jgi:hypothetical protein
MGQNKLERLFLLTFLMLIYDSGLRFKVRTLLIQMDSVNSLKRANALAYFARLSVVQEKSLRTTSVITLFLSYFPH